MFTPLRDCGLSPELSSAGAGIARHVGSSIITTLERVPVVMLDTVAK